MGKKAIEFEKRGDRLDVYREHLIKGKELKGKYADYFAKLKLTESLLTQGYSDGQVAEILKSSGKFTDVTQGYGIIRDCYQIWGDIKNVSKDGRRHVLYESFIRLARKCEQKGDEKGATDNLREAAKLYNLYNSDNIPVDASKYLVPVAVFFGTDPKLLEEKAIETDYEEAE